MGKPMRIVFWQDFLSFHQSAYIRALAEMEHTVTLVVHKDILPHRKPMGWSVPDYGQTTVVVAPDDATIRDIVGDRPRDSVHVLGAAHSFHVGRVATRECLKAGVRIGWMSERGKSGDWKGAARRLRCTVKRLITGRRFDFVLALGEVRWFRQCGYPANKVFPYAYITEKPDDIVEDTKTESSYQILYIGRFLPCKRVDILLRAFGRLKDLDATLTIVGDGVDGRKFRELAQELGISGRISWKGFLPNREAMSEIYRSNVLVLPSKYDGWGAVVNEALMRGVPVVCADGCGASELLGETWRGEIVRAGSVDALTQALRRWIRRGKTTAEEKARIKAWSQCIEGRPAAEYLLKVLEHVYDHAPRPSPPWYTTEG
jgi:glycosyltransferase involved in cell wall biosynthesis